jgi:hypothetical protein
MNSLNLTPAKVMGISVSILGALMVANTQLTDLFGAFWTTKITSGAALLNMILGGVVATITGPVSQDQQVRQVLAMPGVEPLQVNRKASPELAQLAVDPTVSGISAKPSDRDAVNEIASAKP